MEMQVHVAMVLESYIEYMDYLHLGNCFAGYLHSQHAASHLFTVVH